MSMQTKGHSKFLIMRYFLRISSKLKKIIKIAQTKAGTTTCNFVYRIEYAFHLSLINKVCEYSPSQQHFLIVSHRPNIKESLVYVHCEILQFVFI